VKNMLRFMKEIYRAYENGKPIVGPTEIARKLKISKSTAYNGLKNLASDGYGTYIEKKGFIINLNGIKLAKKIIRKHRLIECFIADALFLSPKQACIEADKIDSIVGEEFVKALEKKYGNYTECPCGNRIPK